MPTAVIVGSHSAIAQAMVKRWLPDYDLVTLSRRLQPPLSTANTTQQQHYVSDYSAAALAEVAQSLKGRDIQRVFCCVGTLHDAQVFPEKKLTQLDADHLRHYFDVNTVIPAMVLKTLVPILERNQKGVLAFLSAQIGSITDNRLGGWYGYRASKAALNMLIKTASIELARTHKQMCIVAMHPGTTESPLSEPFQPRIASNRLYTPAQTAARLDKILLRLTPEDSGQLYHWDGSVLPW
jgi:NAD(P)-dependent dehydrogenase (short-subunit alcohol dehydrogenase family)